MGHHKLNEGGEHDLFNPKNMFDDDSEDEILQ